MPHMLLPDLELVHSPDDGGWYLHDYSTNLVSQTFASAEDAVSALEINEIIWED